LAPGTIGQPVIGATMNEILALLIQQLSFLYAPGRFRFVDSATSTSFGGDAYLVLESGVMRVRFVRDRGQIFMDFQGLEETPDGKWFSLDVVRRLITGERQETAELVPEQIEFVQERFSEIEDRFTGSRYADTAARLKELELNRAKELFS
jgi:hypothetical protein